MNAVYVIGDLHGHYDKFVELLQKAGLIDQELRWSGGNATLCCMGDFTDRGPDGIGCIDLIMRLQQEAKESDGELIALLGNHEPLLLAAYRFGAVAEPDDEGKIFLVNWLQNGGTQSDLERLTDAQAGWISSLPAMALVGDWLLIHADSVIYVNYGASIEEVNSAFRTLLQSDDATLWSTLLTQFSERMTFHDNNLGSILADGFLQRYGGKQIVHGHTPISHMAQMPDADVVQPYVYAKNRCVNVDHGLYRGGPGFICQLRAAQ